MTDPRVSKASKLLDSAERLRVREDLETNLLREAARSSETPRELAERLVALISTGSAIVDQIAAVVEAIRKTPNSRRLIVSAWNPALVDEMALPPCHCLFQFYVAEGRLSCQLYQRSGDIFLGVPFNIASYALMTAMVAQVTGLKPGTFVHTLGDAHIYHNHFEQARLQLTRMPGPLPVLKLNPEIDDLFAFRFEDIAIENYEAAPHIAAPVAV